MVVVSGVHHYLDKELWTPQAFERDFGEELADLVDCRLGMALLQLPSKTFWAGFDNMSCKWFTVYIQCTFSAGVLTSMCRYVGVFVMMLWYTAVS